MGLRINLFGQHSNRTPLAYCAYQQNAASHFEFVGDPYDADVLLTGFSKDFHDKIDLIRDVISKNTSVKLVVISEEPLWDTIYANQFQDSIEGNVVRSTADSEIEINYFAHHNSSIFNFSTIPYYLTTSSHFPARYISLISSWLCLKLDQRRELLTRTRKLDFFTMAEKRLDSWFRFTNDGQGLMGLSIIRSEIAEAMLTVGDALVLGRGFEYNAQPRQKLPDWHLDKLARSYLKANICSALENTYHKYYVTEKIFDALACGSVPLYYAAEDHSIFSILGLRSIVNAKGLTVEEVCDLVRSFIWSSSNIDALESDASGVLERFKKWEAIRDEIDSRSDRIIRIIKLITGRDP